MVHTGAKTQFGGLKEGLLRVVYQVSTEVCVAKPASIPTSKQMATEIRILVVVFRLVRIPLKIANF